MTRRPYLDERDPAEPADWQPTSHAWARKAAIEATKAAVARVRDARTNRVTAGHVDDAPQTEESTDE